MQGGARTALAATLAGALLSVGMLAGAAGCRCNPEETDAGTGDGGPDLLPTATKIAVVSTVTGIEQLHVTVSPIDLPNMGGPCAYQGNSYEGLVPAISVGPLDLTCADTTNPDSCVTFHIAWAGAVPTVSDLGAMDVTGVGEINCRLIVDIEGLGTGGAVLATGTTMDAYAFYGITTGPMGYITLQ
ncbi:MAG TPA: hypothetical protein VG389_12910 [Myxococcota bacterium]|jgi:hypothetical protein|nr:hypothetical protein [Myxococcota bacterium]